MALPKDIQLATELEQVLDQIEAVKAQLAPLEEREEIIRTELCAYLMKIGRDYTRTNSGLGFGLVKGRVSFAIKKGMEDAGIKWAMLEYPSILTVSAAKLNKVVQPMMELPVFIERKEGEPHLSVRTTEEA